MDVLGIPGEYVLAFRKDRITTAVHKSWLKSLIQNRRVPEFIPHDTLSLNEIKIWLHQSEDLGPSWQKIIIKVINKQYKKVIPCPKSKSSNNRNEVPQLSFAHIRQYISHRNHKYLWKECCDKHGSMSWPIDKKHGPAAPLSDYDVVMRDLIQRMYNCTLISLDPNIPEADAPNNNGDTHSNILPAICALETNTTFLTIHPYLDFTLQDCISFSPALLATSHAKPLFIIYQLLQAMRSIHDRGLLLGEINCDDIFITQNLWIQIIPKLEDNIHDPPPKPDVPLESSIAAISNFINGPKAERVAADGDELSTLCDRWVHGAVSNLDYLTALNEHAGRRFGDPTSHHVVPWVTDFTHPTGGNWRDLSKSKFRLNKGDRQLDLTYDAAAATAQTAHHVTDVLSEITYYVYLSRRTPKSALRRHVRSTWVPAEYPPSVQRLQQWTPDECIPEFFTDPAVFESIHEDLADLQLPLWASSAREFIDCHRQALESAHVSARLHQWIDLTFGFKLSGHAAVRAKNVCLHLADGHTGLRRTGVVQLFTRPHPQRRSHAPCGGRPSMFPPRRRQTKPERSSEAEDLSSGAEEDDAGGGSMSASALARSTASTLAFSRLLSRSRGSLLGPMTSSEEAFKAAGEPKLPPPSIILPRDYDPAAALAALESQHSFAAQTFRRPPPAPRPPPARPSRPSSRGADARTLGRLLVELFLAAELRPIGGSADRLAACRSAAARPPASLPRCVRAAASALLLPDGAVSPGGLPPPTPHQLLQPLLAAAALPFPPPFPAVHRFLSRLHALAADAADARVALARDELVPTLPAMLASSPETLDVVMPFVGEMMAAAATAIPAAWELFDPIARVLGPARTTERLLDATLRLYDDVETDAAKRVKLYHRSFVLKLVVRFGLATFLENFATPLVEAAGGCKDSRDARGSTLKSCALDDAAAAGVVSPLDEGSSGDSEVKDARKGDETDAELEPEVFAFEAEDGEEGKGSPVADGAPIYDIMDHLDLNAAEPDEEEGEAGSPPGVRPGRTFKAFDGVEKGEDAFRDRDRGRRQECKASELSAETLVWLAHRLGPVLTARHLSRNLLRMLTLCYLGGDNLAPLLFDDDAPDVAHGRVVGDRNAARVLDCLAAFAALYGEQMILLQYLPHMSELIAMCKKRPTANLEAGLVGCLALLTHIVPYLRDATIMDQLQDGLLRGVLHPAVRLVSTTRWCFPSGAAARAAAAGKLVGALHRVASRIGAEMTRAHLAVPSLQRLFLAFDRAFARDTSQHAVGSSDSRKDSPAAAAAAAAALSLSGSSEFVEIRRDGTTAEWAVRGPSVCRARPSPPAPGTPVAGSLDDAAVDGHRLKATQELKEVFTAELAHDAYLPFYRFVGPAGMEQALKNHEFVQHLCCEHEAQLQVSQPHRDPIDMFYLRDYLPSMDGGIDMDRSGGSGSFGSNVAVVGNRIDLQRVDVPSLIPSPAEAAAEVSRKMDNTDRHLHGNWLAYWEHEIGRAEKDARFNFKQIKLQTFNGHTLGVRCILPLDNENSFISAGRDKTVRLWSLRSQGDGSASSSCRWTYAGHRKSVLSLSFIESCRLAASCDSSVHLWDPFLGSVVAHLTADRPVTVLKAMPAPSSSLLAAAADATLRIIDTRTCSFVHELKVSANPAGLIRCLAVSASGHRVAVGQSSGFLTLLDVRTGLVVASWKAHEGEVLQLAAAAEDTFVSSSLDQSLAAWSAADGKLAHYVKGPTETVHCLSAYGSELISGTTANRIGVHTAVGPQASFSSTRLRADTFRGALTAMAVLPLNRLLLLGADNGSISLLC